MLLVVDSALDRGSRWLGRPALLWALKRSANRQGHLLPCGFTVAPLGAMLIAGDDEFPAPREPVAEAAQQIVSVSLAQGLGVLGGPTQLYLRRDLVHILPARPCRA